MKKQSIHAVLAIAFLFIVVACIQENSIQITRESPRYSFTAFLQSIKAFPYEAPKMKQEKLKREYANILLGMSKTEVEKILGPPDAEFRSYDSRKKKEQFLNSSWAYYLYRSEKELANEKVDKSVFLYFDVNDRLFWALPTNIETLVALGNPLHAKSTEETERVSE